MDVAGFRHVSKSSKIELSQIELGTEVYFEEEPDNKVDPGAMGAIRIVMGGNKIGYVTRAHLFAFHQWLRERWHVKAWIERKSEQLDNPIVYLFVKVVPRL